MCETFDLHFNFLVILPYVLENYNSSLDRCANNALFMAQIAAQTYRKYIE